jgi:TonB family protein
MPSAALVLQSSVALAVALAAAFGFRRRSAALRHFVLASGVAAVLVVAVLPRVTPAWQITLPAAAIESAASTGAAARSGERPIARGVAVAQREPPTSRAFPAVSIRLVLTAVWLAGLLVVAVRLILGLIGLRRVAARAATVHDDRLRQLLRTLKGELRVTRPVRLLFDDAPVGTWGVWRPSIVLPAAATAWPDDRARAVLAHELAHVQRFDWLVQLAAHALCAALWFNPLAWVVARRLRDEGERACDDVVLGIGFIDREYATHLFDIARATSRPALSAAVPMARPSSLEGRIAAMLNPTVDRRVPSTVFRIVAATFLLVAASAAAVRVTAQQAGPAPLQGTVYDSSGAVLPGVEMALVNEQGVKWSTPTDGQGRFEFAPVGAGKYVLEAAVPGFRTLHQDVVLDRDRDWKRNITLQLGELQETIMVTARRPAQATPPPASAGVVRVGGNIKVPTKVFNVAPVYPPSMQASGLEGVVKLDVLIATDGTVASVRVANGQVHPAFAAAAAAAVRQWKFTPTLLNGQPVEVEMTASIAFSLTD